MLPNKRAWKWKRGTCSTSTSIPIAIRNLGLNLAVREPVLYSDVPVSFACVFFSCILHVQVLAWGVGGPAWFEPPAGADRRAPRPSEPYLLPLHT